MENIIIRKAAETHGVKLWEIAERLGIADGTFSRRLRRELSSEEQKRILSIIENIRTERRS